MEIAYTIATLFCLTLGAGFLLITVLFILFKYAEKLGDWFD